MSCEALIGADEAAELLGIHPKTVKRMAAAHELPGMKIGKLWRFRASALDDWIKARLDSSRHLCPVGKEQQ